jgi:Fe2+ transport system protein FeoA
MTHPHPAVPSGHPPVGQSLASVAAGQRVRLLRLAGGRKTARRLADLGLTIGSTATVMHSSSTAVILAARGSRLALGRPLAEEITVTLDREGVGP